MALSPERYLINKVELKKFDWRAEILAGQVYLSNGLKFVATGNTLDLSFNRVTNKYFVFASPTGKDSNVYEFRKVVINGGFAQLSSATYYLAGRRDSKNVIGKPKFYLYEGTEISTNVFFDANELLGKYLYSNSGQKLKIEKDLKFVRVPKFTNEDVVEQRNNVSQDEAKRRNNVTPDSVAKREFEKTNGRSGAIKKLLKNDGSNKNTDGANKKNDKSTRVRFPNNRIGSVLNQTTNRPYFLQRFSYSGKDGLVNVRRKFVLEIVPNSLEFSQLSSTWSEIERSSQYSLVDWSKNNLLKVSFRFLVAANNTVQNGGRHDTFNGLELSIDDELENLRNLAATKVPVQLVNFTDYLTNTYRYPFISKSEGIYFIINEMSVSATRFTNKNQNAFDRSGSIKNVAAAEVTVTLTEYPKRPDQPIVALPALTLQVNIPPAPETTPPGNEGCQTTETSLRNLYGSTPPGYTCGQLQDWQVQKVFYSSPFGQYIP
jgi:hypothetical protein